MQPHTNGLACFAVKIQRRIFLRLYAKSSLFCTRALLNLKEVRESQHMSTRAAVEEPPFEISETGWGEFEILVRIYFADPDEKPIDMKHYLKLYPDNTLDIRQIRPPDHFKQHCVVQETHDEIIFHKPTDKMRMALNTLPLSPPVPNPLQKFCKSIGHSQSVLLVPPPPNQQKYLRMCGMIQQHLNAKSQALKLQICQRTQEVQTLIDIYHLLQPEKALQILVNEPQVLNLLATGNDADGLAAVNAARAALKNMTHQPTVTLNKEKLQQILDLFDSLVAKAKINKSGLFLENLEF